MPKDVDKIASARNWLDIQPVRGCDVGCVTISLELPILKDTRLQLARAAYHFVNGFKTHVQSECELWVWLCLVSVSQHQAHSDK